MKKIFILFTSIALLLTLIGCIEVTVEGKEPYIKDGYWYVNGNNTGVKAEGTDGKDGVDGKTPYIQDGYWFIDGINTGIKAECSNCGNNSEDDVNDNSGDSSDDNGNDNSENSSDDNENDNSENSSDDNGNDNSEDSSDDNENDNSEDSSDDNENDNSENSSDDNDNSEDDTDNNENGGSGDAYDVIDTALPSYWKDYLDIKITEINAKYSMLNTDGDAFIFITDQHLTDINDYSAEIINYIAKYTPIKKVIFGGDMLQGGNSDIDILRAYRESFADNVLVFAMRGNHDAMGNLTKDAYYDIMIEPLSGIANTTDELYYYYDNADQKIRYIVTDSVASGTSNLTDASQISWMQSKILELEKDWTAIIIHHGIWEGSATNSTLNFSADGKLIIDALDEIYDATECTIAGIYSGHTHRDYIGYSEKGYVLISTTLDASANGLTKYDPAFPNRNDGTTTEQTFDIVFINPLTHSFETIRIGAGDNKTFTYASNEPRDVESISINKSSAETWVSGTAIELKAILTPANATDKSVIWSIESGENLGTISSDGLLCKFTPGATAGTVIIKVETVCGDFNATCTITIAEEPTSFNITDKFTWTPGSIAYATGVASSQYASDWLYSNLVDVSSYNTITFSHIQTTNSVTPLGYAFYDENGNHISGASNGGVSYDTVEKTIEVPNGAKYFRVMWMNTTHSRYNDKIYNIDKFFYCYGNLGDSIPEVPKHVQSITMDKTYANTTSGGAPISITATIEPIDASNTEVIWSIKSGEELGTLNIDGAICTFTPGKAAGTVIIEVITIDGEYRATCKIDILNSESVNITDQFTWIPGSIAYATGVASSQYASDWLYSNLVDVSSYNTITFSHIQTTNSVTPLGYAFYDENGNHISGASNGGVSYDTVKKTIEVPNGAKYFRVMWMNTTHSRYNDEIYNIDKSFYCYGNPKN